MRIAIAIVWLVFGLMLQGCSRSTPGTQETTPSKQDIREITLSSGGEVTYTTGNGRSDSVTFRRDGTAEMRSEATEKFVKQPIVVKRARFSTDRFERLAKVFEENGFFEKETEGNVQDAWRNLKVVTSKSEKTLQTLGRDGDPQIRAMLDAVNALAKEVQWEEVK
jgi:hypothetical protein